MKYTWSIQACPLNTVLKWFVHYVKMTNISCISIEILWSVFLFFSPTLFLCGRIWCLFLSKMVRIFNVRTNPKEPSRFIFTTVCDVLRPVWRQSEGPDPSRQLFASGHSTAAGGVRGNVGRKAEGSGRGERVRHDGWVEHVYTLLITEVMNVQLELQKQLYFQKHSWVLNDFVKIVFKKKAEIELLKLMEVVH